MMLENLEKLSSLVDVRIEESLRRQDADGTNVEFQELKRNYKVYNSTTLSTALGGSLPILPRGTMILIDTRPAFGASGVVAKYSSLGDRYVEEWAKQVNP